MLNNTADALAVSMLTVATHLLGVSPDAILAGMAGSIVSSVYATIPKATKRAAVFVTSVMTAGFTAPVLSQVAAAKAGLATSDVLPFAAFVVGLAAHSVIPHLLDAAKKRAKDVR